MPLDNHMSVPLKSLYFGLDKLFQPWRLPQAVADQGFDAVKNHYRQISDLYGYSFEMSENLVNMLGYRMMQQQRHQEAISIFEYNVKNYPQSANVYDSLGEGYEAIGEYELALENYQIAVRKGEQNQDLNQPVFLQHLRNVEQKISSQE